jgi:hypothetical protein
LSYAPSFTLDGFTAIYQEWQTNSVNNAPPAATITLDGTSSAASWADLGWSAEGAGMAGYGFFDMWAESSASSDTQTSFQTSGAFHLQIEFAGIHSFTLSPGAWFDLGLIQNFKHQLLANSADFFGPGGSLARLPVQAVIGFNPTITMSMEEHDYQSFQSAFHSETTAGASFGPFVMGEVHSSTYSDKSSVDFNDSSASIKVSPPTSSVPVLLGMISTRLDV